MANSAVVSRHLRRIEILVPLALSLLFGFAEVTHAETATFVAAQRTGGDAPESGIALAMDNNVRVLTGHHREETNLFGRRFDYERRLAHSFFARIPAENSYALVRSLQSTTDAINDNVFAFDIALDRLGNAIIVGSFKGTLTLLTGSVTALGVADMFVAKLTPDGRLLWLNRFGGDGADYARAVVVDARNRISVTGTFSGGVGFGATTLTTESLSAAFLARLDEDGNVEWARQSTVVEAGARVNPRDLAVNSANETYITGWHVRDVRFGGERLDSSSGERAFLVKYADNGDVLWARQYGQRYAAGRVLAIDAEDNLYLGGTFNRGITFGDDTLTGVDNPGSDIYDIFLARFDDDDDPDWARQIPAYYVYNVGLTTDAPGNAILLASSNIFVERTRHTLITKYSTDGDTLWSKQAEGDGRTRFRDVAVAADGRIHLTGSLTGTAVFDDITLIARDNPDGSGSGDVLLAIIETETFLTWFLGMVWWISVGIVLILLGWRFAMRSSSGNQ